MQHLKKSILLALFPVLLGEFGNRLHASAEYNDELSETPFVLSICTDGSRGVRRHDKINATLFQLPPFATSTNNHYGLCNGSRTETGSPIKIKRRGYSSDRFDKKQYKIEFVDQQGQGTKTTILGLAAAEEWVLHGPYIDRSLMRNALAYRVGAKMGALRDDKVFAPRFRFAEVILNDDYQGMYLLVQKINRDKNFVDIPKTKLKNPRHVSYILEISRTTSDFKTKHRTPIEYSYPSRTKLNKWVEKDPQATAQIKEQICHEVEMFEDRLKSPEFADPVRGYRPYIDVDSFVDFLIAEEVFKDIDGFRRSAYFYKGRDNKLHMGPLWDFNIGMGNIRFFGGDSTSGWVHSNLFLYLKPFFWFERLLEDPYFVHLVQERYGQLRQAGMPLDLQVLKDDIAYLEAHMGDAPKRDTLRWKGTHNLVESWILRTRKHGKTHGQHVKILRRWLSKRLTWMDKHIKKL